MNLTLLQESNRDRVAPGTVQDLYEMELNFDIVPSVGGSDIGEYQYLIKVCSFIRDLNSLEVRLFKIKGEDGLVRSIRKTSDKELCLIAPSFTSIDNRISVLALHQME